VPSELPLPTNPYSTREAEAGSPSKSVTATPSIAVILLTITTALLSVAIERQLRLTNEADARDFILGVFNKIVRGGTLFQ
jgi:hypothetical protein